MRFLPSDIIVCDSLIDKIGFYIPQEKKIDQSALETLTQAATEAALRIALISAPVFIALSIAYHLVSIGLKLPACLITIPAQLTDQEVPESLKVAEFYNHLSKIYCLVLFTLACPITLLHSSKASVEIYKILMGQTTVSPPISCPQVVKSIEKKIPVQDMSKPKESGESEDPNDATAPVSGQWQIVVTPPNDKAPLTLASSPAPSTTTFEPAKGKTLAHSQTQDSPLPIDVSRSSSMALGSRNIGFLSSIKNSSPSNLKTIGSSAAPKAHTPSLDKRKGSTPRTPLSNITNKATPQVESLTPPPPAAMPQLMGNMSNSPFVQNALKVGMANLRKYTIDEDPDSTDDPWE